MLDPGSDAWKCWDERRAGNISGKDFAEMRTKLSRSFSVCMSVGTASTATGLADVLGLGLPDVQLGL
ncbi:MAG: dihydroxy-acid dehydratase [Hyphomicrobiaceae bacterium]|nr:dihydroxy-acid dehydratase [Hyphomicrobiaceae bacterium]